MLRYQIENTENALLKPYIESYVRVEIDSYFIRSKELLPRPGASCLLINQAFKVDHKKFNSNCLIGIRDRSIHLSWDKDYLEGISVKFTSFGLSRFVNVPVSRLKNSITDCRELWEDSKIDFAASILETSSMKEKIARIERFLVGSLRESSTIEKRVFYLADQIKLNPSNINYAKKYVPLSVRQLERKFKALLGVNLQTYIRICRFEHAKNQLLQSGKSKLTKLGYDSGYFDQAHFSKEFKRLSLLSPKNFPESYPFYNLMARKY